MAKLSTEAMITALETSDWDLIDGFNLELNEWLQLAQMIRNGQISTSKPRVQMVARIQCILVDADMITDKDFVKTIAPGEYQ